MEKRKVTIAVEFNYLLSPDNTFDWETDQFLQGLFAGVVKQAGLQDMVDNLDAKVKQQIEEHDWKCEPLHISHSIFVGDVHAKGKKGKIKTQA